MLPALVREILQFPGLRDRNRDQLRLFCSFDLEKSCSCAIRKGIHEFYTLLTLTHTSDTLDLNDIEGLATTAKDLSKLIFSKDNPTA